MEDKTAAKIKVAGILGKVEAALRMTAMRMTVDEEVLRIRTDTMSPIYEAIKGLAGQDLNFEIDVRFQGNFDKALPRLISLMLVHGMLDHLMGLYGGLVQAQVEDWSQNVPEEMREILEKVMAEAAASDAVN